MTRENICKMLLNSKVKEDTTILINTKRSNFLTKFSCISFQEKTITVRFFSLAGCPSKTVFKDEVFTSRDIKNISIA